MKHILLLLLLIIQTRVYAQKEATNWYFGYGGVGLDFSSGHPVPLTDGAMRQLSGCATMSDKETGELLFYTNGVRVWNRQHQVMPGSHGLLGTASSTQSALIVPFPNQPQRYYLFHVDSPEHPLSSGLVYSIVNMELDGGLGDIEPATKNTRLLDNTAEKLTAVPHANGKDYWIITHGFDNDIFYVYLLTEAGITGPEAIPIGVTYLGRSLNSIGTSIGYLKASPDGRKLASAVLGSGTTFNYLPFQIFDFDPATGRISNAVTLDEEGGLYAQYGVSFSPDNTKVYLSSVALFQWDLSLPTIEDIINSKTEVVDRLLEHTSMLHALQLGPDGRLYTQAPFNKFRVIKYPNRVGMACEPELLDLGFDEQTAQTLNYSGLPNFIQSYFNGLEPLEEEPVVCAPEAFQLYPNPTTGKVKFGIEGDCDFGQRFDLKIVNAIGQNVVVLKEGISIDQEMDISGLSDGLYLFMLIFPGQGQVVKKVVKIN